MHDQTIYMTWPDQAVVHVYRFLYEYSLTTIVYRQNGSMAQLVRALVE